MVPDVRWISFSLHYEQRNDGAETIRASKANITPTYNLRIRKAATLRTWDCEQSNWRRSDRSCLHLHVCIVRREEVQIYIGRESRDTIKCESKIGEREEIIDFAQARIAANYWHAVHRWIDPDAKRKRRQRQTRSEKLRLVDEGDLPTLLRPL